LDKGYLPEALVNGVALMGWNPPHREDPTVLAENTGVFMKHEVITLPEMVIQFNLDKIQKTGAKFDLDKISYLNSMHIR
jgi:glutamyl/glutaminyl-tRNA synthetase